MSPVRIGIVGCGRIARAHLEALQQLAQFNVVALCDSEAAPASATAAAFGVPDVFETCDSMAATARLDAALICTPPVTHHDIAVALMQRGIHVLCEKPLANSLRDARHMAQVAQQTGRTLLMAAKFRYVEDVIKARDIVRSGRLGEVTLLSIRFCSPVDMAGRWNADPTVAGGGVIMDNGPHAVDLARFLIGPIEHIQAQSSRRLQSLSVEDTALLSLQMAGGALGTVTMSWSVPGADDYYLQLMGSRGALSVGWKGSSLHLVNDAPQRLGDGYDKQAAFVRQLEHFAACVRGAAARVISLDEALACTAALEAAYRSVGTGRMEVVEPAGGDAACLIH